jgi:glycerol-3-phosphate acyltransferase PlsY
MTAQVILWAGIGFFCGSLMFSYWLGKLALGRDIRTIGDGNPGTTNVFRAGGKWVGILAFALDALKGAIPVSIAKYLVGIDGVGLVIVSLAPILGHAFSPFLRFQGGKAAAVSLGVWMALTLWEIPFLSGITLAMWYSVTSNSGWAICFTSVTMMIYLLLFDQNPVLYGVMAGNIAILAYKYRADLRQPPALRPWITRRLWSSNSSPSAR